MLNVNIIYYTILNIKLATKLSIYFIHFHARRTQRFIIRLNPQLIICIDY